jgi:hypothetical protein
MEPLDDEVARLLEKERHAQAPGAGLGRVWSRLGPIALIPGPGAVTKPAAQGWLASHVVAVAVASFVGGAATGIVVYSAIQKKPAAPRIVYVDHPTLSIVPAPTPSVLVTPEPQLTPSLPVAPAPHPSGSTKPLESLRTERDVLDHARLLLTGGDAQDALTVLDNHATRFPRPQLSEEREALAIQALVALGHYDDARARARAFHEATPNSLFAPVIDSTLASIP